jgi:hypothetical protein
MRTIAEVRDTDPMITPVRRRRGPLSYEQATRNQKLGIAYRRRAPRSQRKTRPTNSPNTKPGERNDERPTLREDDRRRA